MKPLPVRIRWHMWVYGHALAYYNDTITVAANDIGSRGLVAHCECSKRWSL